MNCWPSGKYVNVLYMYSILGRGSFALITVSVRRGMEVISLWHCWGGVKPRFIWQWPSAHLHVLVSCFSFSSWHYNLLRCTCIVCVYCCLSILYISHIVLLVLPWHRVLYFTISTLVYMMCDNKEIWFETDSLVWSSLWTELTQKNESLANGHHSLSREM